MDFLWENAGYEPLSQPKPNALNHEVAEDKVYPGTFRVEAIDHKEGDCFVTIFSGPNAESRATEYAAWKNAQ